MHAVPTMHELATFGNADMPRAAPRGRSNALVGGALVLAAIAGASFPFWYTRAAGPIVRLNSFSLAALTLCICAVGTFDQHGDLHM